jgi:non-ribosomal peptide synthetase component F
MLGVLAAGRGFVPLDACDPTERIRWIATKSGAAAVVTTRDLATRLRPNIFARPARHRDRNNRPRRMQASYREVRSG